MRPVPRHRFGAAHAGKPRQRNGPAFQCVTGFSTPRCPGSGFAPPLAAPNAQAVPAHHTEPFTCRFFSHDPSASARILPHRPHSNSRRVCSRQRRCAMDERLDELRVSARPQHWGDLAVFCRIPGIYRKANAVSAETVAASAFSTRTPETWPATAPAAPAPPAATGHAWRTCASHASGSYFPCGPSPRRSHGRSCPRLTAPPPGSPSP